MGRNRKKKAGVRIYIFLFMAISLFIFGLSATIRQYFQVKSEKAVITEKVDEFNTLIVEHCENTDSPPGINDSLEDSSSEEISDTEYTQFAELRDAMEKYNQALTSSGQKNLLIDIFSYEAVPLDLSEYGLESDVVGIITIPKMNVELPLLLGANYDNLQLGCAILTETSMPIGGESTNCVIAGHRGWNNQKILRDIEKLEIGDLVYVQNIWETLVYQVCQISIIYPDEIEKVYIQEGRDLITLVTCHPYRVNSHRYVVYCERVEDIEAEPLTATDTAASGMEEETSTADNTATTENVLSEGENTDSIAITKETFTVSEGIIFESSQNEIFFQNYFPWICMGIAILLLPLAGLTVAVGRHKETKQKSSKKDKQIQS